MSASVKPYIGPWRDHVNGVWTLTMPDREAGILAAALLIFTGFVASRAWSITKFVAHQVRAREAARDVLWYQQQAAIRNSNNPLHALWYFVSLAGAWFRLLGLAKTATRSFFLVLISLTSLVAWSTAQLFVSYIWTSAGDHFLVDSGLCGAFSSITPETSRISEQTQVWAVYYRDRLDEASTYERQCYNQDPHPSLCGRFPVPRLDWAPRNGRCPVLEDALCIKTNTTPVVMESGFINSNDHLGVNAKPEDTIEYRKIATCAPLQTNRAFTNSSAALKLGPQHEWFYGHNYLSGSEITFSYPLINQIRIGAYRLMAFEYDPAPGATLMWKPNATMFARADAQMSLFFLITDYLRYFGPVYDQWFLTDTDPLNVTVDSKDGPVKLWEPLLPARILACEEVHQLCNRNLPFSSSSGQGHQCANFTLAADKAALARRLELSPRQNSTWQRLAVSLLQTSMRDVAWMLSEPIEASRTVLDGSQYAKLPVDQWRREVGRWFAVGLAMVQHGMVEFVTGPAEEKSRRYFVDLGEEWGVQEDCRAQRVRGVAGVRNFDIKGIVILVVLGSWIALVGLSLDTAVGLAQKWAKKGEERRLGWILDGVFQIQRFAFEGAGIEGWRRLDSNVPITAEGVLPRIDATDRACAPIPHPAGLS